MKMINKPLLILMAFASTGMVWWYGQVKRDPFAYQAKYTEDNVVGISTRADLEMVNAKKALQSQNL
jgi:hypothetical protein